MVGSTDYKARESEKLRSVGRGVSFRDRRIVKERCRKEILWEELAMKPHSGSSEPKISEGRQDGEARDQAWGVSSSHG